MGPKSTRDEASWAIERSELKAWLLGDAEAAVLTETEAEPPEAEEWRRRFHDHLAEFGHSTYNLDFAQPVPADDPAPILAAFRFFLAGQGADPYRRQAEAADRRDRLARDLEDRLDPVRRKIFQRLLSQAQLYAPIREDALADIGLAWPQLRRMLAELGRRLTRDDVIKDADQVYWLQDRELRDWLAGARLGTLTEEIAERHATWRGQRLANPPQMLPIGFWSKAMAGMMPAAFGDQTGPVLRGIGASSGSVTATARVLGGPADFSSLQPGDVLVASITTPAWTSLFAKASAVVTDIGGPLSHSSIVAREYGIPAVLGTGTATRRIRSGEQITVDGDAGRVTLLDQQDDEADQPVLPRQVKALPVIAGLAAVAGIGVLIWRRRRRTR